MRELVSVEQTRVPGAGVPSFGAYLTSSAYLLAS